MIVPGGFEGAKGSFGECTGINLDVRSFVREGGGDGGRGIDGRSIASVRFARRDRLSVFRGAFALGRCTHPRFVEPRATIPLSTERGSNKCARVRSTTRRALDIEAKEGRERERE